MHDLEDPTPSLATNSLADTSAHGSARDVLLERREGPDPRQWQAVKETLRTLYQKNPLREVKKIMEKSYGFYATERMYKARLLQWRFYRDKDLPPRFRIKTEPTLTDTGAQERTRQQRIRQGIQPYLPPGLGIKTEPPLADTGFQERIRSYLPLSVGGKTERALADTGAQENVMCEAFAKELNLTVTKSKVGSYHFVNAIGGTMEAIGYTTIHCSLEDDEPQSFRSGRMTRFWVFSKLVEPLVVGRNFLENTGTLTKWRHQLQKIIAPQGVALRILHLELPRWRINSTINDEIVLANPDTGSDLDLLSLAYVQHRGLRIQEVEPKCEYVEFADGSQKKLSGAVLVRFNIGSRNNDGIVRQFYVLEGLTSDVLLGNNTLEEFDAFNAYRTELVDLEEYDNDTDFHLIRWVQKSGNGDFLDRGFQDFEFSIQNTAYHSSKQPQRSILSRLSRLGSTRRNAEGGNLMTVNESQARSEQYLRYQDIKEARRRRQESERISKLPSSASQERVSAEVAEATLRRRYDRDRSEFVARHVAALNLAVSANRPIAVVSTSMPQANGS